jgi:hypothetical protein
MYACFVKGSDGIFFKSRQIKDAKTREDCVDVGICTHIASDEDRRFAEQLGGILRPNTPKKDNGSGVEPPEPLYLN